MKQTRCRRALFALILIAASTRLALAAPVTIYDSHGFEQPFFLPGPVHGQSNTLGSGGNGGTAPAVFAHAVDPIAGQQSVRLTAADVVQSYSLLAVDCPSLAAAGYTGATVSFDSFRTNDGWMSNLWFSWADGAAGSSIQWDGAAANTSRFYPFGFSDLATNVPVARDRWGNTTLSWNFLAKTMTVSYDGQLLGTRSYSGNPLFSRWIIYVSHDEAAGSGTENVLIDNLLITAVPEPAHCIGLAMALMICGRTRRR